MALSKIDTPALVADSVGNTILDLSENYAFTGTVSGTSVAGTAAFAARGNSGAWTTYDTGAFIPFDNDALTDSFEDHHP